MNIIGIPEGTEREQWAESVFEEIMAENLSNLEKETTSRFKKHRDL